LNSICVHPVRRCSPRFGLSSGSETGAVAFSIFRFIVAPNSAERQRGGPVNVRQPRRRKVDVEWMFRMHSAAVGGFFAADFAGKRQEKPRF
jgi:hypothetical protein